MAGTEPVARVESYVGGRSLNGILMHYQLVVGGYFVGEAQNDAAGELFARIAAHLNETGFDQKLEGLPRWLLSS